MTALAVRPDGALDQAWEVWRQDRWEAAEDSEARLHIKGFIADRKELPPGAFWLPSTEVKDSAAGEADVAPGDILVHYRGADYFYGRDIAGHDVEVHRKTGKPKRLYTLAQRREAIERHALGESYATIAKDLETTKDTVASWCRRA